MSDRELRWALADMLAELFTAGKIAAAQPRQMTGVMH
jgi:hypothetical protein